jgi:hypothetical protein
VSEAKVFKVKTRLATVALGGGGLSVGEAVKRAEAAVELTYEASLAEIDRLLSALESGYGMEGATRETADYDRLYAMASQIIDISICLRDSQLDNAARAFCDLIDLSAELEVWDPEAIAVHIQVMRLLRQSGAEMGAAERAKLVQGLHQVTRKRVGDAEKVASRLAS